VGRRLVLSDVVSLPRDRDLNTVGDFEKATAAGVDESGRRRTGELRGWRSDRVSVDRAIPGLVGALTRTCARRA